MHRLQQESGMALLLVLVVITLLASLLSEFAFSTLVDLRLTETFRDRTAAYYLARGGVEAGRIILQVDDNGWDHPSELWGQGVPSYPVGEGTVSIEIEDLSGRLNLNNIASNNNNNPGYHSFVALCEEVLALSRDEARELAESLKDWQNADPQATSEDDSFYLQQQPPYERKAGALDVVEELNLIQGFNAETVEKLSPYLKVVGDEKLNINTASSEMLYAWQYAADPDNPDNPDPALTREDISALIAFRDQQPLEDLADLEQIEGYSSSWRTAWRGAVLKGTVYTIRSEGQVNEGIRVAEAIVEKQANQVKLLSIRVE